METTDKTVSVVTVKDTIEALKKVIDNKHEAYVQEVKSMAADYAVRGLPEAQATSIEQFIESVRATYSLILNNCALELGDAVREELGALRIFSLKQKIKVLKLKENSLKPQLEKLKGAKARFIGQMTDKEFKKLDLKLNCFTGIECVGYILAFLSIGDNIALASIWGLLLGTGQTTGIKALVLWMRDGSGATLAKVTKIAVWVGVAIVATGLGLLRYATIQANADDKFANSAFAPFVFILISYFLISVLALYVWHSYPTTDDRANFKKAAALDDEIATNEAELKQCQDEINQLTEDCHTVEQVYTLLIQAGKDFYHRANNHFLYSVGTFKSTNLITRTDNFNPVCFSQPVLSLQVPNYDAWNDLESDSKQNTDNHEK